MFHARLGLGTSARARTEKQTVEDQHLGALTVANAVAKPMDEARPMRTAVECPSSARARLGGPGRGARSYGSEGWGFESLRARQVTGLFPSFARLSAGVWEPAWEPTGVAAAPSSVWLMDTAAARLSP